MRKEFKLSFRGIFDLPTYLLGFQTRRDSITFRGKGTEVSLLSLDKGTMGQAQNLAKGRDGLGQPDEIWEGTWDRTGF
jgi:hypothetical protein